MPRHLKLLQIIVLSLSIMLAPVITYSSTNVGGWDVNPLRDGISTVYEATRQTVINGANAVKKASVRITPTALQVAKHLKNGGGGAAIGYAVTALVGFSVDWILDPANNSVNYRDPSTQINRYSRSSGSLAPLTIDSSVSNLCSAVAQANKNLAPNNNYTVTNVQTLNGETTCSIRIDFPNATITNATVRYRPTTILMPGTEKSISLPVVAVQVLNDAANNPDQTRRSAALNAVHATSDTAIASPDAFPNSQDRPVPYVVPQFELTATTESTSPSKTTTTTKNPDGTLDTTGETELPAFCSWVPVVCEASQYVITQPKVWAEKIEIAYNDAVNYFKEEPTDNDPYEFEIEQEEADTDFDFAGTCPVLPNASVTVAGVNINVPISFEKFCELLTIIKPVAILMASLSAVYIVGGRNESL